MSHLLLIGLGGAIGSIARYGVTIGCSKLWGHTFPYGTLVVNGAGGFLVMFIVSFMIERGGVHPEWRFFLITGVLGGLTTFSTFTYETVIMVQEGEILKAFLNIILSLVVVFFAAWMGVIVGKSL